MAQLESTYAFAAMDGALLQVEIEKTRPKAKAIESATRLVTSGIFAAIRKTIPVTTMTRTRIAVRRTGSESRS